MPGIMPMRASVTAKLASASPIAMSHVDTRPIPPAYAEPLIRLITSFEKVSSSRSHRASFCASRCALRVAYPPDFASI